MRSKVALGRFYSKTEDYTLYVNKIHSEAQRSNFIGKDINKHNNFEVFMSVMFSVEFHELGHKYGFRSGCSNAKKCNSGECYWCSFINYMIDWFAQESFDLVPK